ncbi:MAG TPA: class I SAM-dependent methyltransferase [Thermoplasmata archaeon]|nr:class I SAM-dependent methyltransferase [Thermoplasmata archaeon]
MPDHYFTAKPAARHREETVRAVLHGRTFVFLTDAGVFARGKLDRGTELLARRLTLAPDAHVLDVGCGYGVLGIVAATLAPNGRVVMTDINERAIDLAARNIRANAVPHAEVRLGSLYEPVSGERFDAILSNPPIRAGKRVVHSIAEGAPAHLRPGGLLWMVVRTAQGAKSLEAKIRGVLGRCETVSRGSGYRVLRSPRA